MKAQAGLCLRWGMPLLGLLALSLLVWFLGPLLALGGYAPLEPAWARALLIVLLFALWGGRRAWRLVQARRNAARVMQGLAGEAPDALGVASAEELATLKRRMDEALAVLGDARLGGGERRSLYELPWYVIIGPPGAGKTTALVNSGLRFPLAERLGGGAVRGVGGTRNCDWWFTDEAVLLDTAGRYTTQDSQAAVDKAAWLGFLDLLKTHRRRRPIDGAFVALSLADLLTGGEAERSAQIQAIRARLQELGERLGVRFPIYVLLTKCDLLPGFMEFFDDLSREERAQVWGMTFALDDGKSPLGPLERFAEEFAALERRLLGRLVERLQQERDPARRDLIYGFPQQFAALRERLAGFLDGIFRPSRYETRPLLRGLYFTSGTQEGSAIDRLLGAMAQGMHLDRRPLAPPAGGGRSYFIERLLREVAFAERGLVGANPQVERRRRWLALGVLAASAALLLAVGTLWIASYRANQRYIAAVEARLAPLAARLDALGPQQREALAVLPLLDGVRALAADPPRGARGYGLFQGQMLDSEAQSVYRTLLRGLLAPRLLVRVEDQLRGGGSPEFLYEGLKAYLMLTGPEHYDAAVLKAWIGLDWDRQLPRELPAASRQALDGHLAALLDERSPALRPDEALVAEVRAQLQRLSLAQRVYARVKRQKLPDGLPDFRLSEAAGRDAPRVFVRKSGRPLSEPLSGFFTRRGYREVLLAASLSQAGALAEEQWVLGSAAQESADVAGLAREVRRLYFEDFLREWEALLADLAFVPVGNAAQAVDLLRVLSGEHSPLKQLLLAVARETDLQGEEQRVAERAEEAVGGGTVERLRQRLGDLLGLAPPAGTAGVVAPAEDPVGARFAELRALVAAPEGGTPPIDALLAELNELYVQLGASLDAPPGAEQRSRIAAAAARLALGAERQPAPLRGLLDALAAATTRHLLGSLRSQLNAAWNSEVLRVYRQSLAGRYPLERGSARDASLEDFGLFFGTGGVLDSYFRQYLQPYVDTTATPWRWHPGEAERLGIGPGVLQTFQRAAAIRDAFFRAGGTLPAVRFELKVLAMDPAIEQFLLDLDGQQLGYDHGPSRPVAMQWPGPNRSGTVRLSIAPPGPAGRSGLTLEGPWAWFRLLDQAELSPGGADRFALRLRVDGLAIACELRAGSVFNPFGGRLLAGFRLPERL